jgi:hypothetical protein
MSPPVDFDTVPLLYPLFATFRLVCAAMKSGSERESVELLDFGGFSLLGVKAVRRRRRGGNVGIPRFVRDFQGWGESGKGRVWTFPRFPRPAISTAGVRSAA